MTDVKVMSVTFLLPAGRSRDRDRFSHGSDVPYDYISQPLAKVVAAAMIGDEMPSFDLCPDVLDNRRLSGHLDFKSEAHDQTIDLIAFDKFVRTKLEDAPGQHSMQALQAAPMVLMNVDLRSHNYQDPNCGAFRLYMHSKHLPLPSHTQFVETAVKEAKNVSATDRSEQHRTWMAIVRSATPLGRKKEEDASCNASKIQAMLASTKQQSDQHVAWIEDQSDDNECFQRFYTVRHALKEGHFQEERIDQKKTRIDEQGIRHKKQNAAQQMKQQHLMPHISGLMPCSKITQKRNMNDVFVEIQFCQAQLKHQSPIPKAIKGQKELLQLLESIRLIEEECSPTDQARSNKAFKPMSSAPFKLTD